MKKLLPLLCFALLPLSAVALLEDATVSVQTLPHASDGWMALRASETEKLKTLIEAQLEKMSDLSGIYVGMIRVIEGGQQTDANNGQEVELFCIAKLSEGDNRIQMIEEQGDFEVDVVLKPVGLHWQLDGKIGYLAHGESFRRGLETSTAVPEGLSVVLGNSRALRSLIREKEEALPEDSQKSADTKKISAENDRLTGYFYLYVKDAPQK